MGKDLANRLDKSVEKRENKEGTLTLRQQIERMETEFAMAMPRGMEAKQLIRDALTALKKVPNLDKCEWTSVLGSLMTAAQLGLRPNVLGQCWVLPRWSGKNRQYEATYQTGYQGLLELAYRSGHVKSVTAKTVYVTDEFHLKHFEDRDEMEHVPNFEGLRGDIRLFYARALLKDGGYALTNPMSLAEMERFRDTFASTKNKEGKVFGPWIDHFEEMSHKTTLIQLIKLLPKSTELEVAVAADDSMRLHVPGQDVVPLADSPGEMSNVIDSEAEEIGSKTDAIALREEILAATNTAQVDVAFTRGERQGLLDFVLQDSDGEDRELRQIAIRRRDEL